uniref:Huluwa n=1 Tax=Sphaeramia orbicularis TaxID=375764 RepID=A0A673CTM1_9TELE
MSQVGQTRPPDLSEGPPVAQLTVVVLLLIPCVLLLLLLNCLFLGYKVLVLSKQTHPEQVLLQSPVHRVPRLSDLVFPQQLQDGTRAYMSLSEPVLPHPVTSSRASSRERPGLGPGPGHRIRLLRPDGATGGGSGSLRAPSEWRKSGPVPPRSSGSETDTRVDIVPPNSPMVNMTNCECETAALWFCLSVTCSLWSVSDLTSEDLSVFSGVSLRILSADSDGLSNGVLSSVLEWDYYDPCYVKQNNVPKYIHHRPAMHMKQYWV